MAGYRRFVAYVYEYRSGKKENNCGFIKVEVKEQNCMMEIHLQCKGIIPERVCEVYGFVRKGGLLQGNLLGKCMTEKNKVECRLVHDSMNMGKQGVSLEQMSGMILITETGGFYGTEWDDRPIHPRNFQPEGEKKREASTEQAQKESTEDTAKETKREATETAIEKQAKAAEEAIAEETRIQALLPSLGENQTLESQEVKKKEKTEKGNAANAKQENPELIKEKQKQEQQKQQTLKQQNYLQEFMPFEDGEFVQSWKTQPGDFRCLSRRYCNLRNNRFVLYGYYNFGHLLLAKRMNGQYILGVPGGYDQQEKFMANMFGFPYFKESRLIELPEKTGGYWYRSIDPPNFN